MCAFSTIKTTPQFRSIEQDRYNLCIEQFEKHVDVKATKATNIPIHFKDFEGSLFCSLGSVFRDAV